MPVSAYAVLYQSNQALSYQMVGIGTMQQRLSFERFSPGLPSE